MKRNMDIKNYLENLLATATKDYSFRKAIKIPQISQIAIPPLRFDWDGWIKRKKQRS